MINGRIYIFGGFLMSRIDRCPVALKKSLEQRSLLKVIAGLNNFDAASIEMISWAASQGSADLLDIACHPDLVRLAIKTSQLPVCVSSVEPSLFPEAVAAGAAMVEIGNFDTFYPQGRIFSSEEVLSLTMKTRDLLPEVFLSVTVPHVLPLDQQGQFAIDLVKAGADVIQTEGGTSARPLTPGLQGLVEKAVPTLAATNAIVQALRAADCLTPVMSSSGLSSVTIPMAIASGASGVGVGSLINRLDDQLSMLAAVRSIRECLYDQAILKI